MRIDKTFKFNTSQEAWEGLNEYFITEEEEIVARQGIRTGGQLVAFDTVLRISLLQVDPEFDYNSHFNYKTQKWTSLVNNYVNLNYLDIVKMEVKRREAARDNSYNISFIFDNSHAHGKGCLLSLTFTRRPYFPDPILIVQLRSSEVVKRLNFDFLLIQRMGEYVYGENARMGSVWYLPNSYTMAEVSAMYNIHKPIKDLLSWQPISGGKDPAQTLPPFQKKIWEALTKMQDTKYEDIKYKIHLRAAKVLQGGTTGAPLLAKNMRLIPE